jgi:hypothetical protein
MIYFWNVNALFELTSLIDRFYVDLVIKNILEDRIRGFVDSLIGRGKTLFRSKNWRSKGLIL